MHRQNSAFYGMFMVNTVTPVLGDYPSWQVKVVGNEEMVKQDRSFYFCIKFVLDKVL